MKRPELTLLLLVCLLSTPAFAQQDDESEDEGATVRGQVVFSEKAPVKLSSGELPLSIVEQVQFKPMPLPDDWQQKSQEQRQEWVDNFRSSDEGKQLIAANEAIAKNRFTESVQLDDKGAFVAYDIPQGDYSLVGEHEFTQDDKKYFAQLYGDFSVGDVKEIDLSKIQVDIIRILDAGDEFPALEAKGLDGDIQLSRYRGRPVVIVFAVTGANTFGQIAKELESLDEETREAIHLLLVSLDEDEQSVRKLTAPIKADVALIGGWDNDFLNAYGVHAVPCVWLLDKESVVFMTDFEVNSHMATHSKPISQLVSEFAKGDLKNDQTQDK